MMVPPNRETHYRQIDHCWKLGEEKQQKECHISQLEYSAQQKKKMYKDFIQENCIICNSLICDLPV